MSPEQITVLTTFLGLIDKISGWPFGVTALLILIGPWVMALLLDHKQGKRFEAVVRMYENNVKLVEENEALAKDLKEVVIMNTQAMTKLAEGIDKNQFCPMVRLEKRAEGMVKK